MRSTPVLMIAIFVVAAVVAAAASLAFRSSAPTTAARKPATTAAPKPTAATPATTSAPTPEPPQEDVLTDEERRQAALDRALESNGQKAADLDKAKAQRARQARKAAALGLARGELPDSYRGSQYRGTGSVHTVPGNTAQLGTSGSAHSFIVQVEDGLEIDEGAFSRSVNAILGDSRSWVGSGSVQLTHTSSSSYDFRIVLASPALVDALCAPLTTDGIYSCRNGNNVMINYYRWMTGAYVYPNDIDQYHIYMINHEVGHALGQDHRPCPGSGSSAPVMLQQSIGNKGCVAQPWPLSSELASV